MNPEKEVPDAASALEGAGHILAERLADDADARSMVRRRTWDDGVFASRVATEYKEQVTKFEMYYDYREPLKSVPSHRMLAMRRGEKEEVLYLSVVAPTEEILAGLKSRLVTRESIFRPLLEGVAQDAYKRLIAPSIEVELRLEAKNLADEAAIKVFAQNLRNLLLAPPAGGKRVLGIDPGLRTGSKLAAVDGTGRFLEHVTVYPHTGESRVPQAKRELLRLVESHTVEMIAIGNGTAGREMELFAKETLAEAGKAVPVVMVSEAGARWSTAQSMLLARGLRSASVRGFPSTSTIRTGRPRALSLGRIVGPSPTTTTTIRSVVKWVRDAAASCVLVTAASRSRYRRT